MFYVCFMLTCFIVTVTPLIPLITSSITYSTLVPLFCIDVEAQWCSHGDLLAVAGIERHGLPAESTCASMLRNALVKFYNVEGEHIYTLETPAQVSPV